MDQARGLTTAFAPRPTRFLALDGMRGLAALAVALYHYQQRIPHLDARLPRALSIALQHGNLGVQVFFVLSGFAVARSLSSTTMSPSTLGRFLLRRGMRLDPPYLFTVLLVTFLALRNPAGWPVRPTLSLVAAHFAYLQGLLGMPHLQGVFWTLCIEIQLYAVFGVLFWLGQRARLLSARQHAFGALVVASALAAAALTWTTPTASRHLLPFWPVFCLGVLVERADRIPEARRWLYLLGAAMFGAIVRAPQLEAAAGLVACVVLHLATRLGFLSRGMSARPLLALGRGSYSFYLLHALIGGIVFDAIAPSNVSWDVVRFALAFAASGAAAWALHRAIELPAQRWSRRVAACSRDAARAEPPRGDEPLRC